MFFLVARCSNSSRRFFVQLRIKLVKKGLSLKNDVPWTRKDKTKVCKLLGDLKKVEAFVVNPEKK